MERRLRRVLGHDVELEAVGRKQRALIARYPEEHRPSLLADFDRMSELAAWIKGAENVLDLGGGLSVFAPLCVAFGARATVFDHFEHAFFDEHDDLWATTRQLAVEIVGGDVVDGVLPFPDRTFDAVTTFDSMEHWHHSPRRAFADARRVAQPNALFVVGVPNAVNLRKRIAVLHGRTNWSRFDDWYYPERFHGHVREPTVSDLERIAADVGLADWTIVGRNWLGYQGPRLIRAATRLLDEPLQLRPSLCANIYLVGRFAAERHRVSDQVE